jgi:hypothetical protein
MAHVWAGFTLYDSMRSARVASNGSFGSTDDAVRRVKTRMYYQQD